MTARRVRVGARQGRGDPFLGGGRSDRVDGFLVAMLAFLVCLAILDLVDLVA